MGAKHAFECGAFTAPTGVYQLRLIRIGIRMKIDETTHCRNCGSPRAQGEVISRELRPSWAELLRMRVLVRACRRAKRRRRFAFGCTRQRARGFFERVADRAG